MGGGLNLLVGFSGSNRYVNIGRYQSAWTFGPRVCSFFVIATWLARLCIGVRWRKIYSSFI